MLLSLTASAAGSASRASATADRPVVVLAGASGRLGREILRAAADAGWQVRSLTSDVARARRELGALWRRGSWQQLDPGDAAALAGVMRGADYVVTALGAHSFAGNDTPDRVDFLANSRLIEAAAAARVRHFVFISSGTAGTHRDQARADIMMHVRFWKTRAEEQLRDSGLAYTIIGPGGLAGDPPRRIGLRLMPRERYVSADVSRADVARVTLHALTHPEAAGKSFALVNDRNATIEQWRDELRALPADRPAATADAALQQLHWMSGHWVSRSEKGTVADEIWLAPGGGLMLGMNRTVPAGRAGWYEFLRIEAREDGSLAFVGQPQGQQPGSFRMTSLSDTRVSFFNLSHDFPQGVHYWREGDELLARVDGVDKGKPVSLNYRFQRATPGKSP